jgi:hypothetical protein
MFVGKAGAYPRDEYLQIFIIFGPSGNLAQLFFFITDELAKKAKTFVPEKPFQPGLIFVR